jgi:hypothetical protein
MTHTGTPRKVLRLAAEQGAHADCIAADYPGACEDCRDIVILSLRATYGHLSFLESVMAIMDDLEADERG